MAGAADLRDSLITTAVKFLTNPSVQRCPVETKEKFLRGKGLTDAEVRSAIDKACEIMNVQAFSTDVMLFQNSRRNWFRDNVLPVIIYGGIAYGVYWFYKNCLRHLIFVERPKTKSTEECLGDLRKSMDMLNANVDALRREMQSEKQQSLANTVGHQLDNIKTDISSVKGILLNRNQFPSLKPRSEPPSIPAWQRQSEEATSTEPPLGAEEPPKPLAKTHRSRSQRSESGGSNSSEGEQATKNSDSSLEIIT